MDNDNTHLRNSHQRIDWSQVILREVESIKEDPEPHMYSPDGRYRQLDECIGKGTFKTVYKGVDEEEGKEIAWNVIENVTHTSMREIEILKCIDHPNIIALYDYWKTENQIVFITELMTSGTLRQYVQKMSNDHNAQIAMKIIKKWGKQILEGINHLHQKNPKIIHRDIKTENIFVNASNGSVKIGDLGIATKMTDSPCVTLVGTPEFMATEVVDGTGYTEKIDVYAFGMVLLEMATGLAPYAEFDGTEGILKAVISGVAPRSLLTIKSSCLKTLIGDCIQRENLRPSIENLLHHHFFLHENGPGAAFSCDCPSKWTEIGIAVIENQTKIQVNYNEKMILFDYSLNTDTIEGVVGEMVENNLIESCDRDFLIKRLKEELSNAIDGKPKIVNYKKSNLCSSCNNEINSKSATKQEIVTNNQPINSNNHVEEEQPIITPAPVSVHTQIPVSIPAQMPTPVMPTIVKNSVNQPKSEVIKPGSPNKNDCSNGFGSCCSNSPVLNTIPIPNAAPQNTTYTSNRNTSTTPPTGNSVESNYQDSHPITDFIKETAFLTKRTESTAQEWINILLAEDIQKILDLRILTEEDWEKIKLPIFASRAVKNILFSKNDPIKESELVINKDIPIMEDTLGIREMLVLVFADARPTLITETCIKFNKEDLRNVGELKQLYESDWEKIGVSIFIRRVLKNTIWRKGRGILNDKMI